MRVIEIDTNDHRQVRQFVDLPFRLYREIPQWVPLLRSEALHMLNPRRNAFFRHSEAAFLIAARDEQVAGRLAVLDHRNYNAYNNAKTGFFYLFECEDDLHAAQALFEAAYAWAGQRGLERLLGPKGFSPLDGMGLLVDGFQHRPALGIPYNLPHYPDLLEALGFTGTGDIVSGYLNASVQFPERIHQVSALVQQRRGLRVAQFQRREDLQAIIPSLKELYNQSIQGTSDNYPLDDADVQAIADQMLRFADPRLIKIIFKDEQIVGFLFAYPDISAALQRSKGRLFPTGWIRLLREMRRTPWVNINGMGILKEYRGVGGTALLFSEMQKSIAQRGFTHAELVQIGRENDPMLRELRSLGVDFYKTHRLYQRDILNRQ
jgi:hypothetical protein